MGKKLKVGDLIVTTFAKGMICKVTGSEQINGKKFISMTVYGRNFDNTKMHALPKNFIEEVHYRRLVKSIDEIVLMAGKPTVDGKKQGLPTGKMSLARTTLESLWPEYVKNISEVIRLNKIPLGMVFNTGMLVRPSKNGIAAQFVDILAQELLAQEPDKPSSVDQIQRRISQIRTDISLALSKLIPPRDIPKSRRKQPLTEDLETSDTLIEMYN